MKQMEFSSDLISFEIFTQFHITLINAARTFELIFGRLIKQFNPILFNRVFSTNTIYNAVFDNWRDNVKSVAFDLLSRMVSSVSRSIRDK